MLPRLTIARKIALAVIAIVILCVGTMAWVVSSNLQRGFVAYLNELQTQDLDQLRELLEERYRVEGNFEWLRRQPAAFKEVLDQMKPHLLAEPEDGGRRPRGERPPPRNPGPRPDYPASREQQGPPQQQPPQQQPQQQRPPQAELPSPGPQARPAIFAAAYQPAEPPPAGNRRPPPPRPPPPPPTREEADAAAAAAQANGDNAGEAVKPLPRPARAPLQTNLPPQTDERLQTDPPPVRSGVLQTEAPPVRGYMRQPVQADPPPRTDAPPADPPPVNSQNANPPADLQTDPPPQADPPPNRHDPIGFASRISIVDEQGHSLIGPPDFPPGIERDIKVDGRVVGRMRLMPLRQASGSDASATGFLRGQLQTILLLSFGLIAMAILAAIWLARHLLRPVAALRDVTARLARGEFEARAPLLSRDELAELALHVNAMAEALEESERQRRKMLADVSHELRTPLTVIRGEIEALLDGIRQADSGALESLHAEVLRLNKLVDDLHQLTLADAGDLQYHWQILDLADLLRPALERYQPRAGKAGLDLSWSLPPTAVMVNGDSGRLTQVVTNLLENSVRYTDSGGQIVLALSHAGRHTELTIEDSAPGVPGGAYASIFERLYRTDGARSRESGGSGLGLAVCKAMITAHGGTIVAMPSVLGGVKMLIRLPLDASHLKTARK